MTWIKGFVIVLVALAVIVGTLAAYGASRWAAATRVLHGRLEAAHQPVVPARYDAARELEGLPAPVQRYFRAALRDGQPMVDSVTIEHTGTFNLTAEGAERWRPFTSKQRVTLRRPGLVWDARVSMLPGAAVLVHDAYVAGEGILRPAMMGLVALADIRGTSAEPGGIAEGEFMRWFAEAAWYPTALLPSQGVRWSAVDEHTARATANDGEVSATLEFRFDPATGLIDSVRADARGRTVGDKVVLTPWEGRWSDYAERGGMMVPMKGEVAWLAPQGPPPGRSEGGPAPSGGSERSERGGTSSPRAYWRGTISAIEFATAR